MPFAALVHLSRAGQAAQSWAVKCTRETGVPLLLRWSDQLALILPWGQTALLASQSNVRLPVLRDPHTRGRQRVPQHRPQRRDRVDCGA
ncbi:MAG: hypothetical protein QOI36_6355 [Pseudonocardiales bacterium]|nr:hypothetical protein [Pseudonocardiales bacterium]